MNDALFNFLTVFAAGFTLIGGYQCKALLSRLTRAQENGEQMEELRNARSESLEDAFKVMRMLKNKAEDGTISRYRLVTGKTARGYTIARNSLKNEKRLETKKPPVSLDKSISDLKDSSNALFTHSIHKRQIFLIPYKVGQELSSEVFYIKDNKSNGIASVSPNLQTKITGIKQKDDKVWDSKLAAFFFSWFALYTKHQQVIFEGEELTIFGQLCYNVGSDSFHFNNPLAFMNSGSKAAVEAILSDYGTERTWNLLSGFWHASLAAGFFYLSYKCFKAAYTRYRVVKREKDLKRLQQRDAENQIPGAPPLTHKIPDGSVINLTSYICRKCKKMPCNIVFLPCLHCTLCHECYKKEEVEKKKCPACQIMAANYLRVYTA